MTDLDAEGMAGGDAVSTELTQLIDHMEWADALVWSTVIDLPQAADDERVRTLLYHVHTVQRVYLQIWRDETVSAPDPDDFPDLESIRRWGREYYGKLPGFLSGLTAEALDEPLEIPWAAQLAGEHGTVHPTSLRQSILQVTSHSTYHRGQTNTRIRELGGEPPLTDFVAWIWNGRPGPRWGPSS